MKLLKKDLMEHVLEMEKAREIFVSHRFSAFWKNDVDSIMILCEMYSQWTVNALKFIDDARKEDRERKEAMGEWTYHFARGRNQYTKGIKSREYYHKRFGFKKTRRR